MKLIVAILVLSLLIDESLCQRHGHNHGRRGRNRPLRQRQRQGRLLAAQNPLGPPPQPAILLSSADPIQLADNFDIIQTQVAPRQGRQFNQPAQVNQPPRGLPVAPRDPFRQGRQFDDGTVSGSFPDEDGNYQFEFTDDDGSFRTENGVEGTKDGEVTWTSPEGEQVSISYVADEGGYQASGSHLPQNVPLPDGSPDGPGGSRNNLAIWAQLMQEGRKR